MYDKYNKALPFTVGATLPDHKGLYLYNISGNGTLIAEMKSANIDGGTHGISISVTTAGIFIPLNLYKISTIGGGNTGLLLY